MRITFVLASGFGLSGGERTIAQWAKHLKQRGHQVVLVSPPRREPTLRERIHAWRKGSAPAPRRTSHLDAVNVPRVLLESHRAVTGLDVPDADVIIATWWETAEWVTAMPPSKGAKVHLIQGHEVFAHVPTQRAAAVYHLPFQKIVVAPWLETLMREQYHDPNAILVTVGIDRALFDAPPRGKQNFPTFGFMYSPLYIKGSDVMLDAIASARPHIPNLHLVAFGSADPVPTMPLPPDIVFVKQPPQTMLRELYAQCDAWLYGSRSEGFGLPPMEALACRTPVIGTPVGGVSELIAQGGILVPQDDPAAMAHAMINLAQLSDSAWRALSETAYETVAPYTWERATDQFEAALQVAVVRSNHHA